MATAVIENVNKMSKYGLRRKPTYEEITNLISENEKLTGALPNRDATFFGNSPEGSIFDGADAMEQLREEQGKILLRQMNDILLRQNVRTAGRTYHTERLQQLPLQSPVIAQPTQPMNVDEELTTQTTPTVPSSSTQQASHLNAGITQRGDKAMKRKEETAMNHRGEVFKQNKPTIPEQIHHINPPRSFAPIKPESFNITTDEEMPQAKAKPKAKPKAVASASSSSQALPDTSFGPPSLSPHVVGALAAYNQTAGGAVSMEMALASRQRTLVAQADMQAWKLQLEASCPTRKAMLLSEAEPGGRAFLAAVPAGPKRMEPAVFTAELRHRLGVAEASSDGWCPRCDSVLDTFSLHAGVCIAGGERNQRHNALRDLLCTWADRAGLHPEKEKPGLLLPQRPEETGVARRRPADIFAPCFSGKPTAFDLAVTGFQRQASLAEAGRQGGAAAAAYATVRMAHLDTASICRGQGLTFVPLVAETTGAWDHAAPGS